MAASFFMDDTAREIRSHRRSRKGVTDKPQDPYAGNTDAGEEHRWRGDIRSHRGPLGGLFGYRGSHRKPAYQGKHRATQGKRHPFFDVT